jgi:hypothetical protein
MSSTIQLTLFNAPHHWAAKGTRRALSWDQFRALLQSTELWPAEPTIQASESRVSGLSFAVFRDDTRILLGDGVVNEPETQKRLEGVTGLVIEYTADPLVDEARLREWWGSYAFIAYTSAFHDRPLDDLPPGPRWRVLLPFSRQASPAEATVIGRWAMHPRRGAGAVDLATLEVIRVVAVPALIPGGFRSTFVEGPLLDPEQALAEVAAWEQEDRQRGATRRVVGLKLSDAVAAFCERLEHPERRAFLPWPGEHRGLPSHERDTERAVPGLSGLSEIAGSLWPGRLAVLVGASGSGRTSLALQLAESVASAGHPVLFASSDLSKDELVSRLVLLRAARASRLRGGSHAAILQGQGDLAVIANEARRLADELPLLYLWTPRADERTFAMLKERAIAVSEHAQGRPPLVVVDPVEGFDDDADLQHAYREASAVFRDLTHEGTVADGWPGAAVLAVLSRPPTLQDGLSSATTLAQRCAEPVGRTSLREAIASELGGLGSDAGLVLALARDGVGATGCGEAAVVVAKNRHGHTGVVSLRFHGAAGYFSESPAE